MLTVVGFLAVGLLVGWFLRGRTRLIRFNDRLTNWTIYLFLFVLGLSVGVNEDIVSNLAALGLQAALITLGALLGSLLLCYLLSLHFFRAPRHDQ